LKNYPLFTKSNNDGDMSSIKLSESYNDKDSRIFFNPKKEENSGVYLSNQKNIFSTPRHSQQLDYRNILKFRLKDDGQRNKYQRYSMFNQKTAALVSPNRKFLQSRDRNFTNFLNSNYRLDNNDDNKFFETFKDMNNIEKKLTYVDGKDRSFFLNNNNGNSFAENVRKMNQIKNMKEALNKFNTKSKKNESKKSIDKKAKDKNYGKRFNFRDYLGFKCSFRDQRKDIIIIQKFRKKLLSEEHFFKSHLFIYLIIKKIKIDREDKSEIKDLYSEL
jgi:hypothetical protein